MKETEYILATNRVKVFAALRLLRDVIPGAEYGFPRDAYVEIVQGLTELAELMDDSIYVEED